MESKAAQAKPGQYLTFNLKSQVYGVPIDTVREINQLIDITPVPKTPSFIAGVMNLRGKIVPVVNLRLKFEIEAISSTRESCIIVIEGKDGQVGMIVDSVREVIELTASAIEPRPMLGDESQVDFVMGIGKAEKEVIILVDIVQALSKDNLKAFVAPCVATKDQAAA